jgi:hypothetical protein
MEPEGSLPLGINEINMFHISALNGYIELFITVFTAASTCPYPQPDQSSPHPPILGLEKPF